jgi:hypothetical protein
VKEHKKIYSNELCKDAILGRVEYIKALTNEDYDVIIDKLNNDMYELRFYKNNTTLFIVVNTIDCLYTLIDGYYRALYDSKR